MNSLLLVVVIVIALVVGSTLSIMEQSLQERLPRVVRSDVYRRTALRKNSASCLIQRQRAENCRAIAIRMA
jgi:uroporphyrinogen-III synthase